MARRIRLLIALALLALTPAALAQTRARAQADALFREGRIAFDKGDYPKACAKFEASQKSDPAVGTLLNLAVCEEKLGRIETARPHLHEVLSQLGPKDDRRAFAKGLLDKVEARFPRLTLTLAAGAAADTRAAD